jgi:hypothetical protein
MPWLPDAVATALIAGWVTLAGFLITNHLKISELRQKWIDALRDDVALLITHALEINFAGTAEEVHPSFAKVNEASARIELRLNPKEDESLAMLIAIANLRESVYSRTAFEQVNAKVQELTRATQVVLKKEWQRVKDGEPLYRWTLRMVAAVFVVLLVTLFIQNKDLLYFLLHPAK